MRLAVPLTPERRVIMPEVLAGMRGTLEPARRVVSVQGAQTRMHYMVMFTDTETPYITIYVHATSRAEAIEKARAAARAFADSTPDDVIEVVEMDPH